MKANDRVLTLLKKRPVKGITFKDFGTGFRLASRIYELRQLGYKIITRTVIRGGVRYANYVLA